MQKKKLYCQLPYLKLCTKQEQQHTLNITGYLSFFGVVNDLANHWNDMDSKASHWFREGL